MGILGPTLPDLEFLTHSSTSIASTLFIWLGVAILVGSIPMGHLFDRFEWTLVMGVMSVIGGVFMGLVPWCSHIVGVSLMLAVGSTIFYGALGGEGVQPLIYNISASVCTVIMSWSRWYTP